MSRCIQAVNESVRELLEVSPDDIKFHFKYGLFLLRVMGNEAEGLEVFKRAEDTYFNKV
jgi:hypothetical protein